MSNGTDKTQPHEDQSVGIGQRSGNIPLTPITGVETPIGGAAERNHPNSAANPLPADLADNEDVTGIGTDTDDIPTPATNRDTKKDNAEADSDAIGDLGDQTGANA